MQHQLRNNDFAILYRTNAQSRSFEDALRKKNIPYRVFGGLSFYQRKEIKDVLAYLKLIVNSNDEEALKRIKLPEVWATTVNKISIESNKRNISDYKFIKDYSKDRKYSINQLKKYMNLWF